MKNLMKAIAVLVPIVVVSMSQNGCNNPVVPQMVTNYYIDPSGDTTVYPDSIKTLTYAGVFIGMDSAAAVNMSSIFAPMGNSGDTSFIDLIINSHSLQVGFASNAVSCFYIWADSIPYSKAALNKVLGIPVADMDSLADTPASNKFDGNEGITFTNKFGTPRYKVVFKSIWDHREIKIFSY